MDDIFTIADQRQKEAWSIIERTDILSIWTSIGAEINLVGSLKTGLLINNRDIDFHIYTEPFILSDSFLAISELAQNARIKEITYKNLLNSKDRCIEWHAFYEDENKNLWKLRTRRRQGSPCLG